MLQPICKDFRKSMKSKGWVKDMAAEAGRPATNPHAPLGFHGNQWNPLIRSGYTAADLQVFHFRKPMKSKGRVRDMAAAASPKRKAPSRPPPPSNSYHRRSVTSYISHVRKRCMQKIVDSEGIVYQRTRIFCATSCPQRLNIITCTHAYSELYPAQMI